MSSVERIVEAGGDADDVLRAVVTALVDDGCAWAGVLFREDGGLVLGPQAGQPRPQDRTRTPVVYDGTEVAELAADGCTDRASLERVAALIAVHCLLGWDTGGVPWTP